MDFQVTGAQADERFFAAVLPWYAVTDTVKTNHPITHDEPYFPAVFVQHFLRRQLQKAFVCQFPQRDFTGGMMNLHVGLPAPAERLSVQVLELPAGQKLSFAYCTRRSSLPLVCGERMRHIFATNPSSTAKSANRVFWMGFPASRPVTTVFMFSVSTVSGMPPKYEMR